ncbi:MAG: hypothetical protein V7K48_27865 [Nostoc sp.]|uniref:hypothetical protein n=1 Tax=Nostoc sp. TaxID=1180 RepID=UPI002FF8AB28
MFNLQDLEALIQLRLELLRETAPFGEVKSQKSKLRLRTTKINLGDALSVA